MKIYLSHSGTPYEADLSKPIDLAIPLKAGENSVNCFYAPPVEYTPVIAGDFIGSTEKGGPLNFKNVKFNPHGNGTHTECVGHIAKEKFIINKSLRSFHYIAKLVSLLPTKTVDGDLVLLREQFEGVFSKGEAEAIILRTLPNDEKKLQTNYSGINPPYLHHEAVSYLVDCGVQHLLLDLPSVDREEDGGKLLAHHAFWQYPRNTRKNSTITELIYVDNNVKDGYYLLNIQIAAFDIDVSPSKPTLYDLKEIAH